MAASSVVGMFLVACDSEPVTKVPSFEEYEQAVFAFRDCMAAAGFPLEYVTRTKRATFDIYDYAIPAAGVDTADGTCYPQHLREADESWQGEIGAYLLKHPDQDPAFLLLRGCIRLNNIPVSEPLTSRKMEDAILAAGLNPAECAVAAATQGE